LSEACSGVAQSPLDFVRVFADLGGSGPVATRDDVVREPARRAVVDVPHGPRG
jgi:hypothetical protein